LPLYRAEVYSASGEKKTLRKESPSEGDLLRVLRSEGYTVVKVSEERQRDLKRIIFGTKKKLNLEEQHLFCTTVSSFMKSGLPLADVLSLMQKQTRDRSLRPIYARLLSEVESGRTLAAAMKTTGAFRESLMGMVESGEKSALLAEILEKAGELVRNEISLRRKVQSALTYPALMFIVGMGVVAFLLSFVVPKLTAIVLDSGAQLPMITRILLGLSKTVRIMLLPALTALLLIYIYMKKKKKRIALRFFKDIRENITFAMVFTQLGALLGAGVPLVRALALTAPLDAKKGRLEAVAGHIREGYRFSQGLEKEGSFPDEIVTVIRVGESGSNLPDSLERLGSSCWEYAQASMQKWASLAEPIIILVMGLFVGFVVIAILLPIFDLSSLAGQ
jgi:type II secretory pathway component PulF